MNTAGAPDDYGGVTMLECSPIAALYQEKEMLGLVLSHVDEDTLLRCRLVSSPWRDACDRAVSLGPVGQRIRARIAQGRADEERMRLRDERLCQLELERAEQHQRQQRIRWALLPLRLLATIVLVPLLFALAVVRSQARSMSPVSDCTCCVREMS